MRPQVRSATPRQGRLSIERTERYTSLDATTPVVACEGNRRQGGKTPQPAPSQGGLRLSGWKLRSFLAEADKRGVDVDAILVRLNISPHIGDTCDLSVSFDDIRRILSALAESAPADFAIRMGFQWHISDFSLFGYALLSCRTYGEFFDRWMGHFDYIGLPLDFRSRLYPDGWRLEMWPRAPLPDPALRLCIEEAVASNFPIFHQLTGKEFQPLRIETTISDETHRANCHDLLRVPVGVVSSVAALVMPSHYRTLPIRIPDHILLDYCAQHCRMIAERMQGSPLLDALRRMMLLSRGRPPALGVAAHGLGMSKRSFNRALANEGWTYTQAVNCYRHDYAKALLRTQEVSVKEIAFILGYDSAESLHRAFRIWTGESIGSWTRRELGAPPPRRSHRQHCPPMMQ